MVTPHNKKIFIRSMKTKMATLKRPMVWGSAAVVLMASYLGFEYLTHPERLRFSGQSQIGNEANESLSPVNETTTTADSNILPPSEDNGIGADIDSLSLLFNEIRAAGDAIAPNAEAEAPRLTDESSRDAAANNRRASSMAAFDAPYDLLPQDRAETMDSGANASGSVYSRLFSGGSSTEPTILAPSSSFLQQRSQASTGNPSTPSVFGLGSTRSAATPSASQFPLQDPLTQTPQASPSQGQSGVDPALVAPRTPNSGATPGPLYPGVQSSPNPGTTGYSTPSALRSPVNPYTRTVNPPPSSSSAASTTPSRSGYGLSLPQAAPYPSNPYPSGYPNGTTNYPGATVPTPGTSSGSINNPNAQPNSTTSDTSNRRYSGGGRGGRINTFSNP